MAQSEQFATTLTKEKPVFTSPIRVLLADDSAIIRHAIRQLLSSEPSFEIVGEAENFAQTLEKAAALKPTIVLMDLHMTDESLFEPEFVKSALVDSAACILLMSLWQDAEAIALANSYGASELLDKANLSDNLVSTIKRCAEASRDRQGARCQRQDGGKSRAGENCA